VLFSEYMPRPLGCEVEYNQGVFGLLCPASKGNIRESSRRRKLAVVFDRNEFRTEALDSYCFILVNQVVHVSFRMGPGGQIEAYFLR
jgi:hypothetical protein